MSTTGKMTSEGDALPNIGEKPLKRDAFAETDANAPEGRAPSKDPLKHYKALTKLIKRTPGEGYLEDEDVVRAFLELDTDGGGEVDIGELTAALRACGVPATDAAMQRVFHEIDKNMSGDIDVEEFRDFFLHMEELNNFEEQKRKKKAFIDGLFATAFLVDLLVCGTILVMFSRIDPAVDPSTYEACQNALQVLGGGLAALMLKVIIWPFIKLAIGPYVVRVLTCCCPKRFGKQVEISRLSTNSQRAQMRGVAGKQFAKQHDPVSPVSSTVLSELTISTTTVDRIRASADTLSEDVKSPAHFEVGTKVRICRRATDSTWSAAYQYDGEVGTVLRQVALSLWLVQISNEEVNGQLELSGDNLNVWKEPETQGKSPASFGVLMSMFAMEQKAGADPDMYQAASLEQGEWLHKATGRNLNPLNPTRPLAHLDRHEQLNWTWGATLTGHPLGSLRTAAAASTGFGPLAVPGLPQQVPQGVQQAWPPLGRGGMTQDAYISSQLGFGHITAPENPGSKTMVDDYHQTWHICT